MTAPRKKPGLKIALAAALCALTGRNGERLIPHEHAKAMTADQVISLFQFHHHPIPHEAGGPAEHWNLDPTLIVAHREITAKETIPALTKTRHIRRTHAEHQAAMAAKGSPVPRKRSRWAQGRKIASRPFPKQHRPLRSRKFRGKS